MKIKDIIKNYTFQILTVMFILLYLGRGCTSKKISKTNKMLTENNTDLVLRIDSLVKRTSDLESITLTEEVAKRMMETVMWKFLELEELSDKNHIPINELKYKDKK